ncbi:MAG: acyl-CoA dehydratase activase [bacterium]
MRIVGLDIGSRTVKLAVIEAGALVRSEIRENTFDPMQVCTELLSGTVYDTAVATGYGRHLVADRLGCRVISEIKAFACGVKSFLPQARTVLDIGGQDIKAISLDDNGRVAKFEMNDKCAAGTGRFLEIMAMALGCRLAEFGDLALGADQAESINSMCTVFAESEVVSLMARGAKRENLALGIHRAVANRAVAMLRRLPLNDQIVFVGGVALNRAVVELVQSVLQKKIITPSMPQLVGALGCAVCGSQADTG